MLPRVIYYVLLVFSLILRKHQWLSSGCLVYCLTYSGSAAIHLFALVVRYHFDYWNFEGARPPTTFFGDIDALPMLPILGAACIMITPLLLFSTTIRQLKARPVIVWWGLLCFTAFVIVQVEQWRGWEPFLIGGLATCSDHPIQGSNANCTFDYYWNTLQGAPTSEWWQACNCNADCVARTVDHAPFRGGSNLVPYTLTSRTEKIVDSKAFGVATVANALTLVFITLQGILALIECHWSQRRIRNAFFRLLYSNRNPPEVCSGFWAHVYFQAAKWFCLLFYCGAILMAVLAPLVFILNMIVNEIDIASTPVGEPKAAVGQWSSWVQVGLSIWGAIIIRYTPAWFDTLRMLYAKRHSANRYPDAPDPSNSIKERTRSFLHVLAFPFHKFASVCAELWSRMFSADPERGEFTNLRYWFNDPVGRSAHGLEREKDVERKHLCEVCHKRECINESCRAKEAKHTLPPLKHIPESSQTTLEKHEAEPPLKDADGHNGEPLSWAERGEFSVGPLTAASGESIPSPSGYRKPSSRASTWTPGQM